MMTGTTQSTLLRSAAAVLGVLGGSWYYAIAGLGFLWTAVLLLRAHPAALWESGLDWSGEDMPGDIPGIVRAVPGTGV